MSGSVSAILRGRRILVAEDEYMIAHEIAGVLEDAKAETLGPFSHLPAIIHLVTSGEKIDGALLDVNLGNEAIWPVVDVLVARSIPVVLATGYDVSAIPPAYAELPRCEKPSTGLDLARALAQALTEAQHSSR